MRIKQLSNIKILRAGLLLVALFFSFSVFSQQQYELSSGWKCKSIQQLPAKETGEHISSISYSLKEWMPAVVPGTVLTTLLHNKLIPDPFYGLNNKLIPDIYETGRDRYTYWFVNDFSEPLPAKGEKVWLHFRGINYSCNVYLNGYKLNSQPDKGMYLRQSYEITPYLSKDGKNRLAVIVYPPDPVGNPNGGQGGDGVIAHSITNQYTAGWDWIQPIHDRNTGIWDKVFIKKTKQAHVENTHIVTLVPGRRTPDGKQAPATLKVTTEVENPDSAATVDGTVVFEVNGKSSSVKLSVAPLNSEFVEFPPMSIEDPKLWWPNGVGDQPLYHMKVKFLINGKQVSDEEDITFGIREIRTAWNTHTNSREVSVNGQKIFIKGGNWIVSDAMLRLSKERYEAEVRYHKDMNLNLIRVWGGGITERPEFYDACDKYGILVFQDFWVSGDCNGRWFDPLKKEDTLARRNYPDDHALFIESLEDQIKMLRNHPSLAIWCGGNEIRPPADILKPLRDSLLPKLDGTRFFFEYSNDDSMSLHSADGPYTIQPDRYFWEHRSFPFNSEIGSVGVGDRESIERFIPKEHLVVPRYDQLKKKWIVDSVWQYHKYSGYDSSVVAYGHPTDIKDFGMKAQLVNYNQYRALIESFSAHMWDWYTGVIIWKTQNPWTAMVGQMYDVYLDPNACLYGLQEGSKSLHAVYDPVKKHIILVNNGFKKAEGLKIVTSVIDFKGKQTVVNESDANIGANKSVIVWKANNSLDSQFKREGGFLNLSVTDKVTGRETDDNLYWMPDAAGNYSGLKKMPEANVQVKAKKRSLGKIDVTISNPANGPIAFFIRASLIDSNTYEHILPAFCNNNYISVLPGKTKVVHIEFTPLKGQAPIIDVEGWNVEEQFIEPEE